MNCNWIRERLSVFVDGMLDESTFEAVESHIQECPSCAAELELLKKMIAATAEIEEIEPPADLHLSIKQAVSAAAREECERVEMLLSGFADGVLDEEETLFVQKHLAECLDCSYQLSALTGTMDLVRSAEEVNPPQNLRTRIYAAIKSLSEQGAFERAISVLSVPNLRWVAASAAALAVLTLAITPFFKGPDENTTAKKPVPIIVEEKPMPQTVDVDKLATAPEPATTFNQNEPTKAVTVASSVEKQKTTYTRRKVRTEKQHTQIAATPKPIVKTTKSANGQLPTKASDAIPSSPAHIPTQAEKIEEQVKETIAKVNTEIAAESTKPNREEERVLRIAVARQKPTDQVFTFEDLKEQLAKQKRPEDKKSVTIFGTKF